MDLQKIGTFLKELRNGEGLTQEQLAEKLTFPEEQFHGGKPEATCPILTC